jgi:hypothetical protein
MTVEWSRSLKPEDKTNGSSCLPKQNKTKKKKRLVIGKFLVNYSHSGMQTLPSTPTPTPFSSSLRVVERLPPLPRLSSSTTWAQTCPSS